MGSKNIGLHAVIFECPLNSFFICHSCNFSCFKNQKSQLVVYDSPTVLLTVIWQLFVINKFRKKWKKDKYLWFQAESVQSSGNCKKRQKVKHPLIVASAKAMLEKKNKETVQFLPLKISYRRLELLGHGVFGVVYSVKISNIQFRNEEEKDENILEAICFKREHFWLNVNRPGLVCLVLA